MTTIPNGSSHLIGQRNVLPCPSFALDRDRGAARCNEVILITSAGSWAGCISGATGTCKLEFITLYATITLKPVDFGILPILSCRCSGGASTATMNVLQQQG